MRKTQILSDADMSGARINSVASHFLNEKNHFFEIVHMGHVSGVEFNHCIFVKS